MREFICCGVQRKGPQALKVHRCCIGAAKTEMHMEEEEADKQIDSVECKQPLAQMLEMYTTAHKYDLTLVSTHTHTHIPQ